MNRLDLLAAAFVLTAPFAAKADTIINLNATVNNGTAIGGTPNTLAPTYYSTLNLAAGTYTVQAVGTSTAGAVYNGWSQGIGSNGLAGPNSWQERTAFSTGGSFTTVNGNNVFVAGATDQQILKNGTGNCNVAGNCFNSGPEALAGLIANSFTFTLASTSNVTFYIPDNSYPSYPGFTDNTGGVSLKLSSAATPEPSSIIMLATGALTTAGMVKRKYAANNQGTSDQAAAA